ncbi:hypothetical protein CIHG_10079 [Coccidioides immitis H538.4]|uniref:Uncharacterized protein n=2 Tax=Coccidioides immitis TaxID=5501 RepID=A0A0J8R914_COCIT|nr:hypothetical protein CISG_09069 [Coccidioides immitis RMSCC 3703]KMU92233.1 hypothetical protein CIHG_10079 [Coccidioides immitis H538.4]
MLRSVARALFQASEQPGAESARQFVIEKLCRIRRNTEKVAALWLAQDAGIAMAMILCTAFNAQFLGRQKRIACYDKQRNKRASLRDDNGNESIVTVIRRFAYLLLTGEARSNQSSGELLRMATLAPSYGEGSLAGLYSGKQQGTDNYLMASFARETMSSDLDRYLILAMSGGLVSPEACI